MMGSASMQNETIENTKPSTETLSMAAKKRGRQPKALVWPTTERFTVKDVLKENPHVSSVTIQNRVNKRVKTLELFIVSEQKNSVGRPGLVYSTQKSAEVSQ